MENDLSNRIIQHFDYQGQLYIGLDRPTFERVFLALQQESSSQDIAEVDVSEIHEIGIVDLSRPRPTPTRADWWKDRIVLWGCGFVACAAGVLLIFGILAIGGLMPFPR